VTTDPFRYNNRIDFPCEVHIGIQAEKIKIYPNPAIDGNLTITGIENIKQIEILNSIGEKIYEFLNLNQSSINIHINKHSGIYIIRFFDGQRFVYKKVIVNN
jgi:Secretion system C-terminal sorting domain